MNTSNKSNLKEATENGLFVSVADNVLFSATLVKELSAKNRNSPAEINSLINRGFASLCDLEENESEDFQFRLFEDPALIFLIYNPEDGYVFIKPFDN